MNLSLADIQRILADPNPALTEDLAQRASAVTRQYFGRAISLYAPLYLSNFCSSDCTYCGFSRRHRIHRRKLSPEEMDREMAQLARTGIENILLLTGESYEATPLAYLQDAVRVAKKHFTCVQLEVHPMTTEEYAALYHGGVDGIAIYQETYDRARYAEVHVGGKKRDYDFRYSAPERIAAAGMRQLSLGILLGLHDAATDLLALYHHLAKLERSYPGVEYSLSFPRLRKIKGANPVDRAVDDISFIRILCLSRLLFPRVGINLSTRETPRIRDHAIVLAATRLSAGSNTAVGGYTLFDEQEQDPQFDIYDNRPVAEIIAMLKARGFDPVLTDWRPIASG